MKKDCSKGNCMVMIVRTQSTTQFIDYWNVQMSPVDIFNLF